MQLFVKGLNNSASLKPKSGCNMQTYSTAFVHLTAEVLNSERQNRPLRPQEWSKTPVRPQERSKTTVRPQEWSITKHTTAQDATQCSHYCAIPYKRNCSAKTILALLVNLNLCNYVSPKQKPPTNLSISLIDPSKKLEQLTTRSDVN